MFCSMWPPSIQNMSGPSLTYLLHTQNPSTTMGFTPNDAEWLDSGSNWSKPKMDLMIMVAQQSFILWPDLISDQVGQGVLLRLLTKPDFSLLSHLQVLRYLDGGPNGAHFECVQHSSDRPTVPSQITGPDLGSGGPWGPTTLVDPIWFLVCKKLRISNSALQFFVIGSSCQWIRSGDYLKS